MEERKFKTAQGMLDYDLGIPNPDDPGMSAEDHGRWLVKFLDDCLGLTDPDPIDITFTITETEVVVEHESGKTGKTERFWMPDFIDALPNAPQRGTAVIETHFYGRMETECVIHTYEIRDPYTGEYDDRTHFIPLPVYLRELVSIKDMEIAYKTLKSLTA